MHRRRVCEAATAPNEFASIGLVRGLAQRCAVYHGQMEHPGRVLRARARATCAEHGLAFWQDLRLDKQLAEGRVRCIRGRVGQDGLSVTGQLNDALLHSPVCDADPAQLNVILG